jgi:hypothetical protein
MSYTEEFATVDLLIRSTAETCGVDAFVLSLIKAERQLRKLFTHLVYQFPCFETGDIFALRDTLARNSKVYFDGFLKGFDAIYPKTVEELIGEYYQGLIGRIKEAIEDRNKIFHGQLTRKYLSRDDLLSYVNDIREWCDKLANSALSEFGYDGFTRNSFQKWRYERLWERFRVRLNSMADYERFIEQHMQRH